VVQKQKIGDRRVPTGLNHIEPRRPSPASYRYYFGVFHDGYREQWKFVIANAFFDLTGRLENPRHELQSAVCHIERARTG
jgi:hypothetical protein